MALRTPNQPKPPLRKRRIVVTVLLIALSALLVAFLVADINARSAFNKTASEIEHVRRDFMAPMTGAVERKGDIYQHGNGFFDSIICVDIQCPTASRQWFVPVEPGKELELARSILRQEGYTITDDTGLCSHDLPDIDCDVRGIKGGMKMAVDVSWSPSMTDTPTRNVSPKNWRDVGVSVERDYGAK